MERKFTWAAFPKKAGLIKKVYDTDPWSLKQTPWSLKQTPWSLQETFGKGRIYAIGDFFQHSLREKV